MAGRITKRDVIGVYRALLGRDPESPEVIRQYTRSGYSLDELIKGIMGSEEFAATYIPPVDRRKQVTDFAMHNGSRYTSPADLAVRGSGLKRILLFGTCLLATWPEVLGEEGFSAPIDYLTVNPYLPSLPPHPFADYAFQVTQIPLRALLFDPDYAEWLRSPYGDEAATEKLFSSARDKIDYWLEHLLVWSDRIPIFVMNFMKPQYNVNGRHFHRSEPSSNISLVERLNHYLAERLSERPNAYLFDLDHLSAVFGRRFIQDDGVWHFPHGALIDDFDFPLDQDRIAPVPPLSLHYAYQTRDFICQLWREAEAMYRSLNQIDAVKMVCVDLDDTLWRGVLAEADDVDPIAATEGWPLGIAEALLALRRRGIILALVSKNDPSRIAEIWPRVFAAKLTLEDFAIVKIGWDDKAQSLREAMEEANLLPRSVVFLDDNPTERANIAQAFPDIRVIDASHYYWKRILMWSAETQGHAITVESARRGEMVKLQVERESERKVLSREAFLARLELRAAFHIVGGQDDKRFVRTLELLNKTNQFNTTGKRWTAIELDGICRAGSVLVCEVADRQVEYGLVLVGIASASAIEQIVMSCRVIGMDVEIVAVSLLTDRLLRGNTTVTAVIQDTDVNLLSRDLFQKCGWAFDGGRWQTDHACAWPAHIAVTPPAA